MQLHVRPWQLVLLAIFAVFAVSQLREPRSTVTEVSAFHNQEDTLAVNHTHRTFRSLSLIQALPNGNSSRVLLSSASTANLITELQKRGYSWETLAAAGVKFSHFSELELLSWLKRDHDKLLELLEKSGLSLKAMTTKRLLTELSRRDDLGKALHETGLGIGADFNCPEDESPRDGGCQVRCQGASCNRAHDVCRKMPHCVKVDVNRDRTWGTLKSLQVYMPAPTPVCDGYVFGSDGGKPEPLAAPQVVEFEVSTPHEEWCYRDTSFSASDQTAYRRDRPERGCTMENCFNFERCSGLSINTSTPLPLFVGLEIPKSEDMVRLPHCLRQTERVSIVDAHDKACLLLPTVNINCQWDQCDPGTHSFLRALPSWDEKGLNHIIWDFNDAANVKYRTDRAMFMKTSMNIDHYRPGFDVPFPLLPNGVATKVTPNELLAAKDKRHVLLSFKGECQPSSRRNQLAALHNGKDVIAVCSQSTRAAQYDYKTLMLSSVFAAAPAGNGLHSYRLAEAIFMGAIPVIVDDKLILPFCNVIDWREFSVRIPSRQIPELPSILRRIEPAKVRHMQARLAHVKEKYFLFPFSTAFALIRLRVLSRLLKEKRE